jgi:hypothetical protein
MQLLLPVNVYTLVHEKENQLRMMMRIQVHAAGRLATTAAQRAGPSPAHFPD